MRAIQSAIAAVALSIGGAMQAGESAWGQSPPTALAYDFIKDHEGCPASAYVDQAGVRTVGCGHTGRSGCGAGSEQFRADLTEAEMEDLFLCDLRTAEATVRRHVRVVLCEKQFAALTSLAFNIGERLFSESTTVRLINSNDFSAAADAMLLFVLFTNPATKKKEFSRGLLNRRQDERALFLEGCT